jgi:hypothetical protein
MDTELTESQSRNAVKVATFAAAITLIGVGTVKTVRYGKQLLAGRKPKHAATVVVK